MISFKCIFNVVVVFEDSNQTIASEYTLISLGSLWICEKDLKLLEADILQLRIENNCWGEFKYNHLDSLHSQVYEKLIDVFVGSSAKLNLIMQKQPTTSELKLFHSGDIQTAKMKMMFNLIFYNFSKYAKNNCEEKELYLIADEPFLEVGVRKDRFLRQLESPTHIPVKHATKCDSRILGTMQLTDLLTGLICAYTASYLFPKKYSLKSEAVPLVEKLKSVRSIDPLTTGRPDSSVKINNWFHRPGIVWKSF